MEEKGCASDSKAEQRLSVWRELGRPELADAAAALSEPVRDWLQMDSGEHRSERSIQRIYLVDLPGAFDGIKLT